MSLAARPEGAQVRILELRLAGKLVRPAGFDDFARSEIGRPQGGPEALPRDEAQGCAEQQRPEGAQVRILET